LVRIPFRYIVPEDKKDKNLAETLKAEGSGILNWMLQGCFAWQKEGLGETPVAVIEATEEYKVDSAPIRRFINERYEVGGEYSTSARDFYNEFSEWWKEEQGDIPPISKKEVGLELSRMNFEKKKVHTGWFWIGLKKKSATEA